MNTNRSYQIPTDTLARLEMATSMSRSEAINRAVDAGIKDPETIVEALRRRLGTTASPLHRAGLYLPDDFPGRLDELAKMFHIDPKEALRLAIEAYTHAKRPG